MIPDYTPYEGWAVKGGPVMTIVRGEIVAENGEIVGKTGYGRFVPTTTRRRQTQSQD
jgi:dihydropyrimidinase